MKKVTIWEVYQYGSFASGNIAYVFDNYCKATRFFDDYSMNSLHAARNISIDDADRIAAYNCDCRGDKVPYYERIKTC